MKLQVRFEPPGFFLNAPRLVLRLGDRKLFDGAFKAGFNVAVDVDPGRHVLETTLFGPLGDTQSQSIELTLDAAAGYRDARIVEAELSYSRLTGNFAKRAALSIKS